MSEPVPGGGQTGTDLYLDPTLSVYRLPQVIVFVRAVRVVAFHTVGVLSFLDMFHAQVLAVADQAQVLAGGHQEACEPGTVGIMTWRA